MLKFWLWVYSLEGVGSKGVARLVEKYGVTCDVARVIAGVSVLTGKKYSGTMWRKETERISTALRSRTIDVIPFWDDSYPALLRQIPDFPVFLFCRGDTGVLGAEKALSIVGTRKMSEYGRQCVHEIVGGLVAYDMNIVSGLAFGADSEAHRVLMDTPSCSARPVAVLPGGPCGGYPLANRDVYEFVEDSGCIVWEFLPGAPVKPKLFAVRNRIIAGLGSCTMVIESPERGGSMITASLALQYDRDVCACPGSIFSDNAAGTNELIRSGAYLIRSGGDVLRCMSLEEKEGKNPAGSQGAVLARALSGVLPLKEEDASDLASVLLDGGCTLDMLSDRLNMDASQIRVFLTKLEVTGILRLNSDGRIKIDL